MYCNIGIEALKQQFLFAVVTNAMSLACCMDISYVTGHERPISLVSLYRVHSANSNNSLLRDLLCLKRAV